MADTEDWAGARRQIEAEIFGRRSEGHVNPSNERMQALVELLGEPQRTFRAIHITGTNGKTSTARMVDSLLREAGLRVGRYTSPHLNSVTERIVVDGVPVSDQRFVEAYREMKPYVELIDSRSAVPLSFFEIVTALAFVIFADNPVDVGVIEVGMGGTWDNTNVVDGEVAVVTPIALDHQQYLGDTVTAIATEKAGIIKDGATAILARQTEEAEQVLLRRCVEVAATVAREGSEFGVTSRSVAVGGQAVTVQGLGGEYADLFLPLHGAHQAENAACALAAVEAFFGADRQKGPLDLELVQAGFAAVRSPGRLEALRSAPTILVDSAHNPAAVQATVEALDEAFDFRRLVVVLGVFADKDVAGVLDLLEPVTDELVVTQNSSPRAVPADELAALAVPVFGADRVTVEPRLDDALEAAVRLAEDSGDDAFTGAGVLVTGSVVTAGEARLLLAGDVAATS